jgi:hypothetical protein
VEAEDVGVVARFDAGEAALAPRYARAQSATSGSGEVGKDSAHPIPTGGMQDASVGVKAGRKQTPRPRGEPAHALDDPIRGRHVRQGAQSRGIGAHSMKLPA